MADKNFTLKIANAIFIGKLNYHAGIWTMLSKTSKDKVNKIIYTTARIILGKEAIGRTDKFCIQQLKWMNIDEIHENTIIKMTHKILNNEENYDLKRIFTEKRERRILADNKVGTLPDQIGITATTQNTFIYNAHKIYNKTPREITLIKSINVLKKMEEKIHTEPKNNIA